MLRGYARVSSADQNPARQIKQLEEAGCEEIYVEKISGATTERKELQRMLSDLKENDVVLVTDLTRISRSSRDLFQLVDEFKASKVSLKSLKDTWLDTTSTNPYSEFLLTVMAGVSQLERDLTRQRQAEGVAIAKEAGKYRGRRKKYTVHHEGMAHAIELYRSRKYTVEKICNITKVSRSALYRALENKH